MKREQNQDTSTDEDKVILEARERRKAVNDAWKKNHTLAEDDIRFRDADQWDETIARDRRNQKRPMLTLSRIETFIDQVVGEQRQNRINAAVVPVDMGLEEDEKVPNLAGQNDYEKSKIYEGLIRQIEYSSKANDIYDTALDHAVGNGFGFWRIVAEYADDSTFNQDIRLKRIRNPFTVGLDPSIQTITGEDALFGFIGTWVPGKEYERQYGEKLSQESWEGVGEGRELWWDGERVRIEEYFRKVPVKRKLVLLESGETLDIGVEAEWKTALRNIKSHGGIITRDRVVETHKVEWYKTNGVRILEGPLPFPSKFIPIIMCPGKELVKRGETIYRSLIRYGKDAQRNYNYWRTATTEVVALAPKSPWVGPLKAFKGLENIWKNANNSNFAYLPYNDEASAPPQRTPPGTIPRGALEEAQSADYDMKATIGIHEAGLGQQGNEKSGKAIIARKRESDTGSFVFIDNLSKAIEHSTRILIDMIPRIYDTERVLRILNEDGSGDFVKVNVQEGEKKLYDLSTGKYDVRVRTGPSFITQREEAAQTMTSWITAAPELLNLIGDKLASNMDWPGADDVARRLRAVVPKEVLAAEKAGEEDEDGQEEQQAPSMEEVQAMVMQAVEETKKSMEYQIKQFEAETKRLKAKGDVANDEMENMIKAQAQGIDEDKIKDIVAEAIAEFIQAAKTTSPNLPAGITGQ